MSVTPMARCPEARADFLASLAPPNCGCKLDHGRKPCRHTDKGQRESRRRSFRRSKLSRDVAYRNRTTFPGRKPNHGAKQAIAHPGFPGTLGVANHRKGRFRQRPGLRPSQNSSEFPDRHDGGPLRTSRWSWSLYNRPTEPAVVDCHEIKPVSAFEGGAAKICARSITSTAAVCASGAITYTGRDRIGFGKCSRRRNQSLTEIGTGCRSHRTDPRPACSTRSDEEAKSMGERGLGA